MTGKDVKGVRQRNLQDPNLYSRISSVRAALSIFKTWQATLLNNNVERQMLCAIFAIMDVLIFDSIRKTIYNGE